MLKTKALAAFAAAALSAGCTQTGNTPTQVTGGPMDPNSVTVFTLAVAPGSLEGCMLADSSMTRPITVTVTNNQALFDADGGIHDELKRVRPNVYADTFQLGYIELKIEVDLSVRPKRLNVASLRGDCKWTAVAP